MKHIEAGLKEGLKMNQKGQTFINAEIRNENTGKSKTISFLIDTGFDGYLQLSKLDVFELGLEIKGKNLSTLANGDKVEVGIVKTEVNIFTQKIKNLPIQFLSNGVSIIGTQLLRDAKKMILFDYEDGYVTIAEKARFKKEIKSLIDKIA